LKTKLNADELEDIEADSND